MGLEALVDRYQLGDREAGWRAMLVHGCALRSLVCDHPKTKEGNMNKHAQALGRLARGKAKIIGDIERQRRSAQMKAINLKRSAQLKEQASIKQALEFCINPKIKEQLNSPCT